MELFLRTLIKLSLLGSALAVILTVLRPLLRGKVSRRAAYYLWLLVLLRLCVPVGIDLPVPVRAEAEPVLPSIQTAPVDAPAVVPEVTAPVEPAEPSAPSAAAPVAPAEPVQPTVPAPAAPDFKEWLAKPEFWAAVWAVGAAASILWFSLSYRWTIWAVKQSARYASDEALEILCELDPEGRAALVESPVVNGPLQIGVARPMIVLPEGMTNPAQLRDVLAHELVHVRRRDLLFKWLAAAVTSLHWFNPLMLLVRREISRACELSCDEAVMRTMDDAGRQHYGETLLALATHAPMGLGSMAVTLCEEKKQLKERLFCIVKYKRSGSMVIFLSLLLAVVVGACSLVTGVKPVEPDEPEPPVEAENESQADDTGLPVIYDLEDGLTVAVPEDIADQMLVIPGGIEAPPAWGELAAFFEKQTYDKLLEGWNFEGGGFLFGISRWTQEQYDRYVEHGSIGSKLFATDGTYYYMYITAEMLDYNYGNLETQIEEQYELQERLKARTDGILKDFIVHNGLEPKKALGDAAEELYQLITEPQGGQQYDFTARVEHNGQTDEFHITPENGYNVAFVGNYLFTSYIWQEAEESEWLAQQEPGTVLTLLSADGQSSIRCRSGDDLAEMTRDGETWYAETQHVQGWDPETLEDPDPMWSFMMSIPEDAFSRQVWSGTANGSMTPVEAAAVLAETIAVQYQNAPSWLNWAPQDFQVERTRVIDIYYGEDEPNFCFWAEFCLLLDNPDYIQWQAGSGLGDPIAEGPFAGYYSWSREVMAEKNEGGDWYISDWGTGGASVNLPGWTPFHFMANDNYLGDAPLEELVDLFFLTEGWTHDYLLPIMICQRPTDELNSLNDLLDRRMDWEAQELCRALAAYLNSGYGTDYEDTLDSVDDLNTLLAPPYRTYTANVPPLE